MRRENHSTAQRNRPLEGEMIAFVFGAGGEEEEGGFRSGLYSKLSGTQLNGNWQWRHLCQTK